MPARNKAAANNRHFIELSALSHQPKQKAES
jgi:hypothetical protein